MNGQLSKLREHFATKVKLVLRFNNNPKSRSKARPKNIMYKRRDATENYARNGKQEGRLKRLMGKQQRDEQKGGTALFVVYRVLFPMVGPGTVT